jgi:hypothetical protein
LGEGKRFTGAKARRRCHRDAALKRRSSTVDSSVVVPTYRGAKAPLFHERPYRGAEAPLFHERPYRGAKAPLFRVAPTAIPAVTASISPMHPECNPCSDLKLFGSICDIHHRQILRPDRNITA